jgi:RHS repeat-associated protein
MLTLTYRRLATVLLLVAGSLISASSGQIAGPAPARQPGQSATLLSDGRWLLVGGTGAHGPEAAAFIFDPVTGATTALPLQLRQPRSGHTATVLSDGSVLLVGGHDRGGALLDVVERIDPGMQRVDTLSDVRLTPRADHSATLLTDGRLLLVGGVGPDGRAVADGELLEVGTGLVEGLAGLLGTPRSRHQATLRPDGLVVIAGGTDGAGNAVQSSELFDPQTEGFIPLTAAQPGQNAAAALVGSIPADGAADVAPDVTIALRFSAPLRVASVGSSTVSLTSNTLVPATVVAAEGGRLVFVRPSKMLEPGATYQVALRGLIASDDRAVPEAVLTFTVSLDTKDSGPVDPDAPQGGLNSPWRQLKPLQAAPGITAVAGQVLKLNGAPLADVTLRMEDKQTRTDRTGRFLLAPVPAGHQELIIDGRTANTPGHEYGVFEVGVDVVGGRTNALSYTSWMPRIDTVHALHLSSPTTGETVVTTPAIPGLEVRLPAGTIIRDIDGAVAHEISITPIPLDQPPFPLPAHVYVPVYFTVQPGGGYVYTAKGSGETGARLLYPNYRNETAGKLFDFWRYEPDGVGWRVYGQGQVTPDRRQIAPEPGVRIYEFTGAMVSDPSFAPPEGPQPCNECEAGDPVDLGTGLFVLRTTDLAVPDFLPIALTRTYRTRDNQSRAFGMGASHPYNMFLIGDSVNYSYADLILGDGGRVHFVRTSQGTSYLNAIFKHTGTESRFHNAKMLWNQQSTRWNMTLGDGTMYEFPDSSSAVFSGQAALTHVWDRFRNELALTRDTSGNLTRIQGITGSIDLTYDTSNRVIQATDSVGRHVGYEYNASGRVWKVTDVAGGVTEYSYDSFNRLRTITDPRGFVHVTNYYDANSRVIQQTMADGGTYQFAYTLNNGKVTQTEVTDPRGFMRRVAFNPQGYWTSDTRGVGQPEEESVSVNRDPATNFILSQTDMPLARQTVYGYDDAANLSSITRLAGTSNAVSTSATYDQYGLVTSVTDALSHKSLFGRSFGGFLASITDPLGHQVTNESNRQGQTVSTTDAAGTVRFEYAGSTNVAVTNPLGFTKRRVVDGVGRTRLVIDALGRMEGSEYDALNQPKRLTDPLSGVTQFEYDANGNLSTVTDARNGQTIYTYDSMNRISTRTDPLTLAERYAYDLAGNMIQFIDRRGQITNYSYDCLSRLHQVIYVDGQTVTYTYDGGNRLRQVQDSINGTTTLDYDGLDRLTSETTQRPSDPTAHTVTYGYDDGNRRRTLQVDAQPIVNYDYDDANRLTTITQGTSIVTFEYDAANRRTAIVLPNGVRVEYDPDAASQVQSMTYKLGQTVLGTLTYTYDAVGHRTSVGGSWARTVLPSAVSTTTYDAGNRLRQWGASVLTYDENGNLLTDGVRTYDWDTQNRLSAIGGATAASFSYDQFGRRVSKTVGVTKTDFLYDGVGAVQELVGGSQTANMLLGPRIDEVLSRTDAGGARTIVADAVGSALALLDSLGAVQTQYTYGPFGATIASGMISENPAQYTGRENDGAGLYFYRARYYDPKVGRFISEDPIGFLGGNNFYMYVENDPANKTDPGGLASSSSECCKQDYLTCLAKCIATYDPLGPAGDTVLTAAGGTFPKALIGARSVLGAGRMTTIPSAVGGAAARGVGRFFSPIWIAYGNYLFLVEVHCAAACAGWRCAY